MFKKEDQLEINGIVATEGASVGQEASGAQGRAAQGSEKPCLQNPPSAKDIRTLGSHPSTPPGAIMHNLTHSNSV